MDKAGLNRDRSSMNGGGDRAGLWALGKTDFSVPSVKGCLPSIFLGQGMLLSWFGLLKGRKKGLLTCLWAVPHPPCASIDEVGDPPAPHMRNPQGHQPGPPDSLVSAGMRDALCSGSE